MVSCGLSQMQAGKQRSSPWGLLGQQWSCLWVSAGMSLLARNGLWQRWASTLTHSVCTSVAEPQISQPDAAQAWLGDARSAEEESPLA